MRSYADKQNFFGRNENESVTNGTRNFHESTDNQNKFTNDQNQTNLPVGTGVIRAAWNVWPLVKNEANQLEIPVSFLYSPFSNDQQIQTVYYEPLRSRVGNTILNPASHVDFKAKVWYDPLNGNRNQFPMHYASQLSENCFPAELITPTIDYILPDTPTFSINYCFVIDTTMYTEEFDMMKDAILQAIGLLPSNSNVALVTFGATVNIHELGFRECCRNYVFKGTTEISMNEIKSQLKLTKKSSDANDDKYLCRLESVEDVLVDIIDNLEQDNWATGPESRPNRCTGVALSIAAALMEALASNTPCRIMLFTGGVCTIGPGTVVGTSMLETIRQHSHIQKKTVEAKYYKPAVAFYTSLTERIVFAGHCVDLFCCSLDQTGLAEMKCLSEKTGGICVMTDTFSLNVFRDTLKEISKASSIHAARAYNIKIELLTSKEINIAGAIGCITSTNKKTSNLSEIAVGEGGTCEWQCGVMHPSSTIAFYLDIVNTNQNVAKNRNAYIQLQCSFTDPSGKRRIRVHTISFPYADSGIMQIGNSFDQEAATVLMSRLAVNRTENEDSADTLRWLDRKLIKIASTFGDYKKDEPESFKLPGEFVYYPVFMYHLRRGQFIETQNNSPDETAYYRLCLLKENLTNTITMISPSLISYDINTLAPYPVMLDAVSLKPECILLMDSFFHVVLWHGEMIARWKDQGYHEMPNYKNFKLLLETPVTDAIKLIHNRIPCPKFVTCKSGGSQERFLLAKANPSNTHKRKDEMHDGGTIITEEANMNTFMEHLVKFAVES